MSCPDCDLLYIAGIACHERGCPSTPAECRECGTVHDAGRDSRTAAMLCCATFEEACPHDPDGLHSIGCGCDEVSE